jgi:hypothetical protein
MTADEPGPSPDTFEKNLALLHKLLEGLGRLVVRPMPALIPEALDDCRTMLIQVGDRHMEHLSATGRQQLAAAFDEFDELVRLLDQVPGDPPAPPGSAINGP